MKTADAASPPDAVVDQAIAWLVRLRSGSATPGDWDDCRRWRESRPDHALAWDRLQGIQTRFATMPPRASSATLESARRDVSRRRALRAVGLVFGGGTALWFAQGLQPVERWAADHHTGTGERRRVLLADGSVLWLDSATAVDVRFDGAARDLVLRHGRILLATGPDEGRRRPLRVHTPGGAVRALGTRFSVQDTAGTTHVQVFEHAVELQPADGGGPRRVNAGEQGHFAASGVIDVGPLDADADAWTDGLVVARSMRLADLAAELDRHRPGRLVCDDAVAELRISGVFSLADTDQTLALIARTLPVRVTRRTRWWVALGAA